MRQTMPGYVIDIAPAKSTRGGSFTNFRPPPKLQGCVFPQVTGDTPTLPARARRGSNVLADALPVASGRTRTPPRQSAAEQGKKALSPQLHRKVSTTAVDKPQSQLEVEPRTRLNNEVKGISLARWFYPQHDECLVDKLHCSTVHTCG